MFVVQIYKSTRKTPFEKIKREEKMSTVVEINHYLITGQQQNSGTVAAELLVKTLNV